MQFTFHPCACDVDPPVITGRRGGGHEVRSRSLYSFSRLLSLVALNVIVLVNEVGTLWLRGSGFMEVLAKKFPRRTE